MVSSIVSLISPSQSPGSLRKWIDAVDQSSERSGPPLQSQVLSLEDALCEPGTITGSVVVLTDAHRDDVRTAVMKLLDVLEARLTPTVLIADTLDQKLANLASDRIIVMPANSPVSVFAATVGALAARQPAFESLLTELETIRRLQGGLSDEVNRLHEELQLAAHVQQQFIPRSLPNIDGVEFGVLFRPCGYVSGDIYDVARLDDRYTGFFVADAVGHGVPAALMTMVLSKAMPSFDDDGRLIGPAESLRLLNTALMKRTGHIQTFATGVCGVIDGADQTITLAGAGHPHPLRIGPTGIENIETEGSLLGVFEDGEFTEATFRLNNDEILLIHSDGFETAFPDVTSDALSHKSPTLHYLDHFKQLCADRDELGILSAMAQLGGALDAQAGSLHQIDDETALVIAMRSQAASVPQAA